MKAAVVPAQITTVEDKIAGNLGLTQILLLAAPIFLSTAVYVAIPPFLSAPVYKIALIVTLFVVCSALAIRIKGRLLLHWTIVLLRYNLRPRHYVFDKNDPHLRDMQGKPKAEEKSEVTEAVTEQMPVIIPQLDTAKRVALESILANPKAKLQFKTDRKGALNVHISEVK